MPNSGAEVRCCATLVVDVRRRLGVGREDDELGEDAVDCEAEPRCPEVVVKGIATGTR